MTAVRTLPRRYLALGLISAGMLAFEVSLSRLFAVQQFHHFAFMVVSLAVLGVSASGLALTLLPRQPPLSSLAAGFSLAVVGAYWVINQIPFDSYAIAWDRSQVWILLLYFTAAAVPFLIAGWAAGLSLAQAGTGAHRPYAVVFLGSGLGAPAALLVHGMGGSLAAVALAAGLGALAMLAAAGTARRRLAAFGWSLAILASAILRPVALEPTLSPYKPLALARHSAGARQSLTGWDPVSRLDAVEGGGTHVFPGMSLRPGGLVPAQVGLFLDADGPLPLTAIDPTSEEAVDLAARMPSDLAHQLRPGAHTLLLDPGGGLEAQLALARGATGVTVPSDDRLVVRALDGPYAQWVSDLLGDPRLTLHPRSSRGVLAASEGEYDLVQFALTDAYRPVTSGAFSLNEEYGLTLESLRAAYRALGPDGVLFLPRWLGTPPSESARAWATILAALEAEGVSEPDALLVAFREIRSAGILVGARPWTENELAVVREFLRVNEFDPIFLPGWRSEEINRRNRLPEPVYHQLFLALLTDRQETIETHDFRLAPTSDDRPFFFHFFRWRQTPAVLATLGQQMEPFGGSGYLVLLALLALMAFLALPLMVVPLVAARRRTGGGGPGWRTTAYFGALGAGYLLVEVPLISRLTLLLDRPAYSLATVLFTLMLASGLGSLLSPRANLARALGALVLVLVGTTALLPIVIRLALPLPLIARLALAVGLLLPAGTLMGIPFAAGLARLERAAPGLIPWAWGLNGAVSGLAGVTAALMALDWGFTAVLSVGAAAYALAFLTVPGKRGGSP